MKTTTYIIPKNIIAELNALPPPPGAGPKSIWSDEQDAILLECWKTRDRVPFIKWFNEKYGHGSKSSMQRHYKMLTNKTE